MRAERNILSALTRDMRAEQNLSRSEFWRVLAVLAQRLQILFLSIFGSLPPAKHFEIHFAPSVKHVLYPEQQGTVAWRGRVRYQGDDHRPSGSDYPVEGLCSGQQRVRWRRCKQLLDIPSLRLVAGDPGDVRV